MTDELRQQYLREIFEYRDGNLYWKINKRSKMKNKKAGYITSTGYVHVRIDGKTYVAHRLIWVYHNGSFGDMEIDHINRTKNDNRIENLRLATKAQNRQNVGIRKDNSTGYKGVSYRKDTKKWRVQVGVSGKQITFGYFDDIELAALVATMAREKYHGDFFNHG